MIVDHEPESSPVSPRWPFALAWVAGLMFTLFLIRPLDAPVSTHASATPPSVATPAPAAMRAPTTMVETTQLRSVAAGFVSLRVVVPCLAGAGRAPSTSCVDAHATSFVWLADAPIAGATIRMR